MNNIRFSHKITVFHGRTPPESGFLVGYAAIIEAFTLPVPMPQKIALISAKNRQYKKDEWMVFTPKHHPEDNLYKHLVFALKYEGVNLLVFKYLFNRIKKDEVISILHIEPTGKYSRKIWFIYEWLMVDRLNIPDLTIKKYVPLVDEKLQYAIKWNTIIQTPHH